MRVWSTFNPAAPGPIGGTTPDAITGTTINADTINAAKHMNLFPAVSMNNGGFSAPNGVRFGNASALSWSPTDGYLGTPDISLWRVGAGILGQHVGTAAQEYQLYGTRTDPSNYERLVARTAAGSYTITPEAAGTGTLRGMILGAASTSIGFFGVTPAARAAAYTPTNVTTDRSFDADATSTAELADVLGTLIADLQAYGLLQ